MDNSTRFLAAFNTIERHFRNTLPLTEEHQTFSSMIYKLKPTDSNVRRFEIDLREFADLRNAIVHERTNPNYVIAEPHESTVEKIEFILQELVNPEKVLPKFQRQVQTLSVDQTISEALALIRECDFTQFPIYDDNNFVGLLTDNGIARWLATKIEDDGAIFSESPLIEVLELEESKNNYIFISRKSSLYELKELFVHQLEKNRPNLAAVLITENGKPNEKLLGIVTRWDMLTVSSNLHT